MVNRHEIVYLAPANYNEQVCIESALLSLQDDVLLVEMTMWDKACKQIKAILWTRFIHINMQTGKRSKHPDWFIEMATPLVNNDLQHVSSVNERLSVLVGTSEAKK